MNTEIAEYIKNHIREYLPPEYQEAHITLEEVTKGNDRRLTGLMIRNDGEITVPTIYLEPYAKQLAQGRPMDEIIREIVQIRTEQDTRVPFEVSDLMDYRQVKPMLAMRLPFLYSKKWRMTSEISDCRKALCRYGFGGGIGRR